MKTLCEPKNTGILENLETGLSGFNVFLGETPSGIKRKRMKCPDCGRKIMSSIIPDHDGHFVIHFIPKHKPKHWWKK